MGGGKEEKVCDDLECGGGLFGCIIWHPNCLLLLFFLCPECDYHTQGDVIVRVNSARVHTVDQVKKAIDKTKSSRLVYSDPGMTFHV